ncbi:hypothetical protein [Haloarcula sp. JP-L23]|uniref:hypothetical protein n=1 Tax=Haloarcula sp. JP-L23 TaxID=2716717 RepID=UPI00140EEA87|nr:hypothetical protein G9465_12300 [Haloarcula sp. JP-L23]
MRRTILAVFLTLTVIASPIAGTATAAPGLNFNSDKSPNPTAVEDELVIDEWDNSEMSSATQYYNDSGELTELPATVNQSQDTPVGVRFDQIDADAYHLFPRIDGESENSANWTVASDWTTSSGSNSGMTVSDADADGVDKLQFAATVASGETATATYADNVSIDSDPNKRVLTTVLNVDTLSGTAEIRAVDGDGDYRYAEINGSADASADDIAANGTGNGIVFAEKLSNLPLAGSGDGSFDGIQKVEIVGVDNDVTVTVAGLDLDKKSEANLAEIERDTDGDGDLETTTVTNYYEGGVANITGLDTLGSIYDNAVINDLHVYDVQYQLSDITDEDEYSTNFSSADDYNYPQKLELYADMEVPSAIDLIHGSITLEFEQGLVESRYAIAEVATGADTTEAFGNLTDDGSYSSVTDTLGSQGSTATFVASASADTNYRVHMVILYQDEEIDTIQATGIGGPTGTSGGGFFSSIWAQVAGIGVAILSAVGLKRKFGGS